jgi:NAD(P)-dependent dehydrogenase (short-subunit alcohol dehydrogenase family)
MTKTVVITGSTRGIGFGLADALLARGCRVTICGRKPEAAEQAAAGLAAKYPREQVLGVACDVTHFEQVQSLWDAAVQHFGQVDIWVNNAGQAHILTDFQALTPEKMQEIVNINLLGTLYGSKVAIVGMLRQGFGSLYNMEGYGSRGGRRMKGMALYGTTKAAIAFLNDSLVTETQGTPVIVGSIQPGMVMTDMLYAQQRQGDPADWERSKRIFNILADRVETAAPWLADRILANRTHGAHLTRLSTAKVLLRFLQAPFYKRQIVD